MPPESIAASAGNDTKNSPPIFQLDQDILLYIFSLNADMYLELEEKTYAVHTLRFMSQVCSSWRDLAIGSPSLWARVINLEWFSKSKEEWRDEVLRRTGGVSLHIKSNSPYPQISMDVVECLSEYWTRIQSLNLRIDGTEAEDLCKILKRPAPSLEAFIFWSNRSTFLNDPDFLLFSNMAPSLRTLSANNMPVDLTTFSVTNLRHLVLHQLMPIPDMLSALNRMRFLERFSVWIFQPVPPHKTQTLPHVTLPRLTHIIFRIADSVDAALSLLAHIIPATGCALDLSGKIGTYQTEVPGGDSVMLYRDILSTYSRYCTELATATDLSITLHMQDFTIAVKLFRRSFIFRVRASQLHTLPEHTVSTLLPSITTIHLEKVRIIRFEAILENYSTLGNPDVTRFIEALVSVEELVTDPLSLPGLEYIQSITTVVILPALKVIHLSDIYHPMIYADRSFDSVTQFLDSRIALGIPAGTLTLKLTGPQPNLEPLQESHGVKIETDSNPKPFKYC